MDGRARAGWYKASLPAECNLRRMSCKVLNAPLRESHLIAKGRPFNEEIENARQVWLSLPVA